MASTDLFDISGKRALVTGASRGIGLEIANDLAAAGATVTYCARSAKDVEAAVASARANGHQANSMVLDVTSQADVQRVISKSPAYHILVNNAGVNRPTPFTQVSQEDYDLIMGLNVKALFFLTQAATLRMIEERIPASIINISSQMGHVGGFDRSVYCASKWAVEGFTRALAVEMGQHSIRVNTICPTFVETSLTAKFINDPEFKKHMMSKILLGRVGKTSDITGAVRYLASDASSIMTGSSIMLDGGWTAH